VRGGGLEARARAIEAPGGRGLNSDECSTGRRVISWWVALRAFFWSALFVGIVAVYIPTRYFALAPSRAWHATPAAIVGLLGIGAGTLVMIACVTEFATRGRGTPAPMDPPRQLVVRGPYRFVRNPMYLGMVLVLFGELSLAFSLGFAGYIAGWFACIHLLVVLYEEPTLRRKFGEDYERYTKGVGRWLPSLRRKDGGR
jgi:protein-S-isoprenylcysteine O-methyltransferase Ste14